MRLTGEEVADASQGKWVQGTVPALISGVGTDSRDFIAGHAFLALRGVTFDGHQHAHQVADKASALIGDGLGVRQWEGLQATPQLEVEDTLQALGDIAAAHRAKLVNTKVIAITGSYGKTTVRSMLSHVCRQLGLEVAATKANFNNLIGVPKTLMEVKSSVDVAIIECGISEVGEMERLSEIVQPDAVVVTGLTHAHGEGLGGLNGVAQEKAKLMKYLLPQGWCVLGLNVSSQFQAANCHVRQTTVDMMGENVVDWALDGYDLTLVYQGKKHILQLALPAKHWAEDMALVATTAMRLAADLNQNWSLQAITEALQTWQPVEGRMRISSAAHSFTLIDDSYNANPASMQAALDTLAALDGHKVAIIGDMLELGDEAVSMHQQLNLHDIDEVLTVGGLMGNLQAANPARKIHVFRDADMLTAWLKGKDFPPLGSTVLVKGSHGTQLYCIAEQLKERGQHVI